MSKRHRNSLDNDEPHHLYVINDEKTKDIFKYGISCDPIEEDGLSGRIRRQLSLYNLIAGWTRFIAEILVRNIPGRRKARQLEDEYIEKYRQKNGQKPPGNRK